MIGALEITADTRVLVTTDPAEREAGMRELGDFVALYVGGMGARGKNFYNQLAVRYGYEAEAALVQDLYRGCGTLLRPVSHNQRRVFTLVPLALLSAASTMGLAGAGAPVTVSAETPVAASLPDGTSVPTEAPRRRPACPPARPARSRPASRARPPRWSAPPPPTSSPPPPSRPTDGPRRSSTPPTRPATSPGSWSRRSAASSPTTAGTAANALDDNGVARPGIYGIALNGKNNTQAIRDTDAGQFDNDGVWHRAVGPMQFIPSTRSVVDADGDSQRNPQDIDDSVDAEQRAEPIAAED